MKVSDLEPTQVLLVIFLGFIIVMSLWRIVNAAVA